MGIRAVEAVGMMHAHQSAGAWRMARKRGQMRRGKDLLGNVQDLTGTRGIEVVHEKSDERGRSTVTMKTTIDRDIRITITGVGNIDIGVSLK